MVLPGKALKITLTPSPDQMKPKLKS